MSYRRKINNHDTWLQYCEKNVSILKSIGLDQCVYKTEKIFREFVTHGTVNGNNDGLTKASELDDDKFWMLHDFISHYFDMDAILFDDFEMSRIRR